MFHRILSAWNRANLIKRISIGIVTGALLALIFPQASAISLLGQIFVGGLKAIAPLLVFTLVANALSQHQKGQKSNMKTVIILYLIGTCASALVAVLANYAFWWTDFRAGRSSGDNQHAYPRSGQYTGYPSGLWNSTGA